MAQQEDEKVKVVYHNDPKRFKFVTKQAAAYLAPKYILAEDQSGAPSPSGQKKAAAAPAASTIDKKAELREKYNELTGKAAEPEWNEARLFVEISKAKAKAPEETAQTEAASTGANTETVITEPAPAPTEKKKRGPKKKNTDAA